MSGATHVMVGDPWGGTEVTKNGTRFDLPFAFDTAIDTTPVGAFVGTAKDSVVPLLEVIPEIGVAPNMIVLSPGVNAVPVRVTADSGRPKSGLIRVIVGAVATTVVNDIEEAVTV